MSLWLLFIIVIVFTVDIPICFEYDYEWVTPFDLFKRNVIAFICFLLVVFDAWFYFFYIKKFLFKSAPTYMVKVNKLNDKGYEIMTFVVTYIFPIFNYGHNEIRHTIVFLILYIALGIIFVKSDLFYNNPTLSLLGFKIYEGDIVKKMGKNEKRYDNVILVSNTRLDIGMYYDYLMCGRNVYYLNNKNK